MTPLGVIGTDRNLLNALCRLFFRPSCQVLVSLRTIQYCSDKLVVARWSHVLSLSSLLFLKGILSISIVGPAVCQCVASLRHATATSKLERVSHSEFKGSVVG